MNPVPHLITPYSQATLLATAKVHYKSMDPSSITLYSFFPEEFYATLRQSILGLQLQKLYDPMLHRFGWSRLGVSDAVFVYEQVSSVLCSITGFTSLVVLGAYSFGVGDYTILHDGVSGVGCSFEKNGLGKVGEEFGALAIFDFSSDWDPTWGGRDVFVDGTGDFVYVPVKGNTCTLISLSRVERFVEYVNHYAQERKRFIVVCGLK